MLCHAHREHESLGQAFGAVEVSEDIIRDHVVGCGIHAGCTESPRDNSDTAEVLRAVETRRAPNQATGHNHRDHVEKVDWPSEMN